MARKVAVIKTGWSADFTGSPVEAAHEYVKDVGDGHEKFNFLPGVDGRFYAFTPPIARGAPKPKEANGWLVFSVAKAPKRPGLYLTGWYEDASFEGDYLPRPEYQQQRPILPRDDLGDEFLYTLSSDRAVRIDPVETPFVFSGAHMKRSPIYYLRGNGSKPPWCEQVAKRLLAIRRTQRSISQGAQPPGSASRGGICADAKRRKEVEEAAIACVKRRFPEREFDIDDRQQANCGFDLLVRRRSGRAQELHIEVKGTQNANPHFLMSHREHAYMDANPRRWRLAMVTSALNRPKLEILKVEEARARFFWKPFTWHATANP